MLSNEQFAEAVWLSAALLAGVALLHWMIIPSLVAGFRQNLFRLRRELFLFALDAQIPFTHPAYTRLRVTINGLLRFAERATFTRVLITGFSMRESRFLLELAPFEELLGDLHDGTRKRMLRFQERIGGLLLKHALATSPVAWLLSVLILGAACILFFKRGRKSNEIWREGEPIAEVLAADPGGLDGHPSQVCQI